MLRRVSLLALLSALVAPEAHAIVFRAVCSCLCNGVRITQGADSLIRSNMFVGVDPATVTAANFSIAFTNAVRLTNEACMNLTGSPPGVGKKCGATDLDMTWNPVTQLGCRVFSAP